MQWLLPELPSASTILTLRVTLRSELPHPAPYVRRDVTALGVRQVSQLKAATLRGQDVVNTKCLVKSLKKTDTNLRSKILLERGDATMQKIKFLFRLWMNEPLWFKCLTVSTLLISIVFSSSVFFHNTNYQSLAKLATAIFFCAFGIIFRRNLKISIIFFSIVVICIFLAWNSFDYASL